MPKPILNALTEALQKRCLVALHRNPTDWDVCDVGYVVAADVESVTLASVTSRGDVIGFEVYSLDVVVGVALDDGESDYLDKISRLVKGRRKDIFREVPCWTKRGIAGTLMEAMVRRRIVTIGYTPEDVSSPSGLVRAMTEDSVSIQTVDQYGEDDTVLTVSLSSITAVHYGTEDEQIRDYLRASYSQDQDD